jgi:hypothetical protein
MTAAWLDIVLVVLKVAVWVSTKVGQRACTAAVMMVVLRALWMADEKVLL